MVRKYFIMSINLYGTTFIGILAIVVLLGSLAVVIYLRQFNFSNQLAFVQEYRLDTAASLDYVSGE